MFTGSVHFTHFLSHPSYKASRQVASRSRTIYIAGILSYNFHRCGKSFGQVEAKALGREERLLLDEGIRCQHDSHASYELLLLT